MIGAAKPYPAMKDSGVPWLGEVPSHWEVRRLGTSVEGCINGIWGNDPNGSEDLPCVRVADFDRVRLRVRLAKPTLRAIAPGEQNRRLLKKGDLLLEKSGGGDLQPVGVVMLYDHDAEAVCSNFIARMPVSARCDSSYLMYLHSHLYAIRLNVRSIKQTTGIQNLDSSSYLGEPVSFPSLPEQVAIVRFLDHADRRIRRYIRTKQKLITLLEEQKQAIIRQAVTGQVDVRTGQPYPAYKPSGVEWLGKVPEHWQLLRLKNVAHVQTGLTLGKDYRGTRTTSRPYLRVANVQEGCLDLTHVKSIDVPLNEADRATLLTGDVLMTEGGDIDKLGRGCVWRDEISKCLHQNHIFAVRCKHGLLSPEFLVGLMASQHGRAYFELTAKQTTNLASTNSSTLRAFPMPLPVLEEQVAIHTVLSEETNAMDHAMGQAEREIDLMREYRTRLIADVVTGKIDVREEEARLPEVDPLADEFDALTTQAAATGMMELEDATETLEELAMENEATV